MKNFLVLLSIIIFAISCSKDDDYDKEKAVSIFPSAEILTVSEKLKNRKIIIPKAKNSNFFNGFDASNGQEIQNFSKNFTIEEFGWFSKRKEITFDEDSSFFSFYGGKFRSNFSQLPIIENNIAYRLELSGKLKAVNLENGKLIYKKQIFAKKFLQKYKFAKISLFKDIIYATIGNNKIAAISKIDGEIIFKKEISSIIISTPVSDGKLVYVTTNDNKTYAFDAKNGRLAWTHSGILRPTAIFGAANPVIYKNFLISSYSSGEIYLLNKKDGLPVFSQDLNLSKAVNSNFYLNDIDATPIVENDIIYAVSNGGLMMAIRLKDGNTIWERPISSITNFHLAANFLYVINNEGKVLALEKHTGLIKWIKNLPNLEDEDDTSSKIIYNGITMASGKLIVSSFDGRIFIIPLQENTKIKTIKIGKKISHTPIILNDKIYLNVIGRFTNDLIELK